MTRLHYPREFRQQSPAVLVKKNTKGAITKKPRLNSSFMPSTDPSPLKNKKMQPRMPEKAQITEPPGSVPDSRQTGANQRSTPRSARLLARLAATANKDEAVETVLFFFFPPP